MSPTTSKRPCGRDGLLWGQSGQRLFASDPERLLSGVGSVQSFCWMGPPLAAGPIPQRSTVLKSRSFAGLFGPRLRRARDARHRCYKHGDNYAAQQSRAMTAKAIALAVERKKFLAFILETKNRFASFLRAAISGPGALRGLGGDGRRRCPTPARTHLAQRRIWL
jgi:hypothetical protein